MSDYNLEDVEQVLVMLRDLLERQGKSFSEALASLRRIIGDVGLVSAAIDRWNALIDSEGSNEDGFLIRGIGAAKPWYPGTRPEHLYWPALKDHLASEGWGYEMIEDLDRSSSTVLASCRTPWQDTNGGRGLVVGYVQSGKTTNFTAVIAKAADVGFRLFIVLSGTTKSLRRQTQMRLDEQLHDLNPLTWSFPTNKEQDFSSGNGIGPILHVPGVRTCIIIKKNKSRLKRLNNFLDQAARLGQLDTCPILVIDDEGDQASLSPNCDRTKATAINKQIVKIIDRPNVSYVAYTATPFANVFVNPFYDENLYPRDFIYSLPEPRNYFGSRALFGSEQLDVIRTIPDNEEDSYIGELAPKKSSSLIAATSWFLMSATARRLRANGVQPHTTMFVNASERINYHFDMWPVVRDVISSLRSSVLSNNAAMKQKFQKQWDDEQGKVSPADFGHARIGFETIWEGLPTTIALLGNIDGADHNSDPNCGIVVDNSAAAYRLAYDDKQPRPIIVIGGNTLSRGLTLEGLVTSVFARSTKMYDTLLQMGRWFGYRRGYEDLQRVWMSTDIQTRFEFLSKVELEIRDAISQYATTGLSPLDFGVRIRLHPLMAITRKTMMRDVRNYSFDLSGTRPQATFFDNVHPTIRQTQHATNRLIDAIKTSSATQEDLPSGALYRNVAVNDILAFFDDENGGFPLCDSNEYFRNSILTHYIKVKRKHNELLQWNVIFRKIRGGKPADVLHTVGATLVSRSRLTTGIDDTTIGIGTLTDPNDGIVDVPSNFSSAPEAYRNRSKTPLLVVYVIDKDSKALNQRKRTDLEAVDHLIGLALFLPISDYADELNDFVIVRGPWETKKSFEEDVPEPDIDDDGGEGDAPDIVLPKN